MGFYRNPTEDLYLSLTVPRYMNYKAFHINILQGETHVSRLLFFNYSCMWNFFVSSWKVVDYICFHVPINCQSRARGLARLLHESARRTRRGGEAPGEPHLGFGPPRVAWPPRKAMRCYRSLLASRRARAQGCWPFHAGPQARRDTLGVKRLRASLQ